MWKRILCLLKGHDVVWKSHRIDLLNITAEERECKRCGFNCIDRIIY